MTQSALVLFAPGFEEIETVTVVDVLRRAGIDVTLAGTEAGALEGSHGIRVTADRVVADCSAGDYDAVVLPGGMPNSQTLADHSECQRLVREASAANKVVGAICAAPIALAAAGVSQGRTVTSHPSVEGRLAESTYRTDRVVRDGKLVTSRGPGTALEFALALVSELAGADKAAAVAAPMLVNPPPA